MDIVFANRDSLPPEGVLDVCGDLRLDLLARAIRLKENGLDEKQLCAYFTDDAAILAQRNAVIAWLRANESAAAAFGRVYKRLDYLAKLLEALIEPTPKKYRKPLLEYRLYREYIEITDELIGLPAAPDCQCIEALRAELTAIRGKKEFALAREQLDGIDFSVFDVTRLEIAFNCIPGGEPTQLVFLDYDNKESDCDSLLEHCSRPATAGLSLRKNGDIQGRFDLENAVVTDLMRTNKEQLKALQKAGLDFTAEAGELLKLAPGIGFYLTALSYCTLAPDYPLCFAGVGARFYAEGLYSPLLAASAAAVDNDVCLDKDFYILTGPNNSGKTEFTVTLGQAQFLFQIGFPVPCRRMESRLFSAFGTLFIGGEGESYGGSRMGEELERFKSICERAAGGRGGLVLLNEPMTSTGAQEGARICGDMARYLLSKGCCGILVTHYYELYEQLKDSGVGCLRTAVTERDGRQIRTYKIEAKPPISRSYAIELACELGLTDGEGRV